MKIGDFKQDFSSSAFKTIDRERRIVGKFCEVTILDDGTFDVWIVRPDREPISKRKLKCIIKGIVSLPSCSPEESGTIQALDGEGYIQTSNQALVREIAFLCGVRKRMRYSEATLKKKRDQMTKIRRAA